MNWYSVTIHPNQVEYSTGKARLIKMPNDSEMKGFMFWHPEPMIRMKGKMIELRFPETWEFKVKKGENAKTICAEAMYGYFTDEEEW